MATDYSFPTAAELREVSQELLPTLMANDPGFDIFPVEEDNEDLLIIEQEAIYTGITSWRGLNGEPGNVKQVGLNRYAIEPGYYGEYMTLDERDLTRRRAFGTFGTPTNITDLVTRRQRQLLNRRINRLRYLIWQLLANGIYTVSVGNQVMFSDAYSLQTYAPIVPWDTYGTAGPLADMRALQLLHRGWSVSFGRDATLYVNQGTFNDMVKNTNPADIFGRRTQGLGTFESLAQVNELFMGDNLPKVQIYDETYVDDSGNVQLFLPNATGVLVGRRPGGEAIGAFRYTRNASNPNAAPGPYMQVLEVTDGRPPRKVEIHDGFNGGVVVTHPKAIVRLSGLHS